MTRDDLLTLIRAWGWTLTGSLPNGRADLWAHPGGMDEVVLPSDETAPDYGRLLRGAEGIIARAEGPRLLAAVRDVQTVHARYFNTDVPPDHEDAGCEPEDVWRFDRDFRAALAPMTKTEETTPVHVGAAALAPEGQVRLMTVPHDGHEPKATCPACPHGRGGEGA